jgi:hypothetical protein
MYRHHLCCSTRSRVKHKVPPAYSCAGVCARVRVRHRWDDDLLVVRAVWEKMKSDLRG